MVFLWVTIVGLLVGAGGGVFDAWRDDPGGLVVTALIGGIGSVAAMYLGQFFGFYQAGEGAGFAGAVVGSILLLAGYRAVAPR